MHAPLQQHEPEKTDVLSLLGEEYAVPTYINGVQRIGQV
jgi:hypothetical protein